MAKIKRVDDVPPQCPKCNGRSWLPYRLIRNGPAAGCVNCGYVIYLTKLPERWERRSKRTSA